jgi:enterochelin esterase-like enzyme
MKTTDDQNELAEQKIEIRSARHTSLRVYMKRFSPFLPNIGSFLLTLLVGILLFQESIIINPISTIVQLGIDEQRAQLIAALLMTTTAALIGALVGRRKLGAVLGGGLAFCFGYLISFIQQELQPVYDPLRNIEPLNSEALVHTSMVMIALVLLCAFVGAAIGIALGEVFLYPLYNLVRFLRQRYARHAHNGYAGLQDKLSSPIKEAKTARNLIIPSMGALALISLALLASSATDLFVYSPDVDLHLPPILNHVHGSQGQAHGTIVSDELVSEALGGQKKQFLVYLPPSYNTPQGQTKRYPTLYLLHGSPGRDSDWFTGGKADQAADTLIASGMIPELILILPDGNGRLGQTSEWGNSYDQRQKIETYVAVDLVKYVDAKYRTIPDAAHRGIAGLSMGGFGAMNIAVHHPNIFGYVSSLGGYYRAEGSIWGNNAAYMRENSPIEVLPIDKQAWHLHIFIGAATKDQPYYSDALQFVQELNNLRIPYQFDVENGSHSWHVWQIQMYHTLLWLQWGNSVPPVSRYAPSVPSHYKLPQHVQ